MNTENIKANYNIIEYIGRYVSLKKGVGLCPFYDERTPSFNVNISKQFFHCFGCGSSGDIISFVQKFEGVSFLDACNILGSNESIQLTQKQKQKNLWREAQVAKQEKNAIVSLEDHINKSIFSLEINAYFATRLIKNVNFCDDIRLIDKCYHYKHKIDYKAIFAIIRDYTGRITGGHRTFLNNGRKIDKMMLASTKQGISSGGHIEVINNKSDTLVVAEGIETIASLACLTNKPYDYWATISSNGMKEFILPVRYKRLIICADKDRNNTGQLAAIHLKSRYHFAEIKYPSIAIPTNKKGVDFNDVLVERYFK